MGRDTGDVGDHIGKKKNDVHFVYILYIMYIYVDVVSNVPKHRNVKNRKKNRYVDEVYVE